MPGFHPGSLAEDGKTQKTFSVYTGVAGRFAAMLPDPMHVLTVETVK